MITLEKNGVIKTMSARSFKLLGGNLDGWRVHAPKPVKPVEQKTASGPVNKKVKSAEPTREDMLEYFKSKGVKVHHAIGDAKLKERYELEIETDKS